ncbi:uncharacterized protein LOC110461241 [Mizuhopecten yessoensis]|uniref:uncharacterized protein LOC110461241 n=1 Tax=Mizuhopecten yessoensis TaxID=6573 RepID=UPI000B45782C|nr:uncharacterized protein LOC110461241 [Mizuhopecten yessoensis]
MESPWDIERVSVLLSKLLEREILGSREIMDFRRREMLGQEYIDNILDDVKIMFCGSTIEGVSLPRSDVDVMLVDKYVEVMYPEQHVSPDSTRRTVLYVKEADCRPGYVALQLGHLGQKIAECLCNSLVPIGKAIFVSSDMYREQHVKKLNSPAMPMNSNGPSTSNGFLDMVRCFHCNSWPREANQWVTRPRLYGWPTQALIDRVVQSGCHLVPVGDKCSDDTLLQWRISFASAERLLVHSFSHIQMKVYFLLKYFLKQLKDTLRNIIGKKDDDILCSYHLKTLMFFSMENSHPKLWQEQKLFHCFWFCFNILISYVRAGHFPQYFIPTNNLFQRKVHGQNQQKLFHIFDRFHIKKLLCLSKGPGTRHHPVDILQRVCSVEVQTKLMCAQTAQEIEYTQDMFAKCTLQNKRVVKSLDAKDISFAIIRSIDLLMKSHSEVDEVLTFANTVKLVSQLASSEAQQNLMGGLTNNKTRYRTLRKCQHRLTLCASMGTKVLDLATLHYLTGNYLNALQMCKQITSQPSYFTFTRTLLHEKQEAMYIKQYCGKGYTSIYKLKKIFTEIIKVNNKLMHLPHFRLVVSRNPIYGVPTTPLSYAVFLSFLCCHELRDKRGRDLALRNMKLLSLDDCHRGHWMVHTMLGICYETIGEYPRAIRAYLDSANKPIEDWEQNPALERIAALRRFAT